MKGFVSLVTLLILSVASTAAGDNWPPPDPNECQNIPPAGPCTAPAFCTKQIELADLTGHCYQLDPCAGRYDLIGLFIELYSYRFYRYECDAFGNWRQVDCFVSTYKEHCPTVENREIHCPGRPPFSENVDIKEIQLLEDKTEDCGPIIIAGLREEKLYCAAIPMAPHTS